MMRVGMGFCERVRSTHKVPTSLLVNSETRHTFETVNNHRARKGQSVSDFTVPPRAHPSTGSQSGSVQCFVW